MSLIEIRYSSKEMRMNTTVTVILPDTLFKERILPAKGYRTLYLLHGFSEDDSAWLRNSCIERYATDRNLAVVMPCGYNSAYTDMRYGQKYFSYLAYELPEYLMSILPLSKDSHDHFVAGDSMGGYGAFKWALSRPDFFDAAVSFSGSLRVQDRTEGKSANSGNQCAGMYGDPPVIMCESQDLFCMLKALKNNGAYIPRLYCLCGTADKPHIYGAYQNFTHYAAEIGVPVLARKKEGAAHTWDYWESMLPSALDWLLTGREPPLD